MHTISVLLAAQQTCRLNSTRTVLKTIPGIGRIRQAQDLASLAKYVAHYTPDLLMLDASMAGNQLASTLDQIKALSPLTVCIVIVQRQSQVQEAARAGADAVLHSGFPTELLVEAIKRLSPCFDLAARSDGASNPALTEKTPTLWPKRAPPYRILVVDDCEAMARSTAIILKSAGYTVDIAFSGQEAWCKLSQEQFHCVLSDVKMAPMDGIELCQRVRTHYPALPVILMTGYDRRIERGDETGALAVLSKPLDWEKLFHLLRLPQPVGCVNNA